MKRTIEQTWKAIALLCCALVLLPSCKTGSSTSTDGFTTVNGDYAMVYAERNLETAGNPTDGVIFSVGGDLMYKDASIPSIIPINVTSSYTQGQGDVSDPSVNFDATKVVFAMRGPNDSTFNLWEMDVATRQISRLMTDPVAEAFGDDVDPAYLPDGRIVFSSNRQKRMQEMLVEQNTQQHKTLDEYEREEALTLHVFNPDTQEITQISFNQSHDRNPTVLKDGRIMFSRWDHVANRNHFPIFTVNPDGTDMFVLYGAFSPGNSFLHPMEQQNGSVMSTLMPLSGTDEGGALYSINTVSFSDNCDPGPACGGQTYANFNTQPVTMDGSFSPGGRYSTPFPLWDGTSRALVSYAIAPNQFNGGIPTETHPMTGQQTQIFGDTKYQIWMIDFNQQVARVVQTAPAGKALMDPVALYPRALSDVPNIIPDKPADVNLIAEPNGLGGTGMGILGVKTVYHTDFLDIMGDRVLVPGLDENIPKVGTTPDLLALKDPTSASYLNRPARFVRVTRALPTPPGISMQAIGETEFEMVEVLGYAPVEPDGSVRVKVPADSAVAISVLDSDGRAFQTHTNWIQARPGETRSCNGCHSPRRSTGSINVAPIAGNHANAVGGETMAETRVRVELNQPAMNLTKDLIFDEYWTNGVETSYKFELATLLTIPGLQNPVSLRNGRINYQDHIQPIWDNNCVSCHNNATLAGGLNLEGGLMGNGGRTISYEHLLNGPFATDENGVVLPPVVAANGNVTLLRDIALVNVGGSANSSRTSGLAERISDTELRAADYSLGFMQHSGLLTPEEKWMVYTWMDGGAQYINDPYELVNGQFVIRQDIVSNNGVSRSEFNQSIQPILTQECASCHNPSGLSASSATDTESESDGNKGHNRFVLTGNSNGDYTVTLAMINNLCVPAANDLLLRPTSDNVAPNLAHPQILVDPNDPLSATQPVFSDTGPGSSYDTILTWISMGAASNPTCLN